MIRCFWQRIPACTRPATQMIVVRKLGRVLAYWNVCEEGHHSPAWYEAMEFSRVNGGSLSTVSIDVPQRDGDKHVNVNTQLPVSEYEALVIVSQARRMSLRQFVRAAINRQVKIEELKGKEDDHQ
jgi:hypothetical protein